MNINIHVFIHSFHVSQGKKNPLNSTDEQNSGSVGSVFFKQNSAGFCKAGCVTADTYLHLTSTQETGH